MSTATPSRPVMPRSAPGTPRGPQPGAAALATSVDPIRVLRRHLVWIIASVVFGAAIGVAAFLLLGRYYSLYSDRVLFEIQSGIQESRDVGTTESMSDDLAFRLANTEAILLTSRDILTRALSHPEILKTKWHANYLTDDGTFNIQSAVDDLAEELNATVIRGSNFFEMSWRTHSPHDVPVVLNKIKDAYLERRKEIDDAVWNENINVFTSELNQTVSQLEDLDREIGRFIRQHGITSLDDPRYHQASIAAEQLTEQVGSVMSSISLARTALSQVQGRLLGTVEPTMSDIQEAEQNPAIQSQIQYVDALRNQQTLALQKFNPPHPAITEANQRLRAAEMELESMRRTVIRQNLESRHKRLGEEIERLETTLAELQRELEAKDTELRELAANHASYQALEAQRERMEAQRETDNMLIKEIKLIRLRADASRVRVAQEAVTPRVRAFPKATVIVPLGTLLTVALTVGIIFLRELTDQRIKSARDLEVLPSARVLGVIPDLEEDPVKSKAAELVVRKSPTSVLAESYRQAVAVLTRQLERNGHQTVLFMAGLPGAGTTTAVTNVAAALAATGKSVLIVDANFRRPHLAEAVGADTSGPGLGDLLAGVASVDEAVHDTGEGISILHAGTPANRVFDRLNNGLFESSIAELRGRFDIILFDAPPAVVAGDAMVLANRVDAAVLVVRAHQEQRGLVARLLGQLADARCEALGILLNRPRGTAGGYFKKNFETMARYSAKS